MKKPSPIKTIIFSARQINDYIINLYNVNGDQFWDWFYSECRWGETNLLSLSEADNEYGFEEPLSSYFKLIKSEFSDQVDDEECLEIKNDL